MTCERDCDESATKIAALETQIALMAVKHREEMREAGEQVMQLTAECDAVRADLSQVMVEKDAAIKYAEQCEREKEGLRALHDCAAKQRDEAERERDENLLESGDITCMETDNPGCGICTMCLGLALEFAKKRAESLQALVDESAVSLLGELKRRVEAEASAAAAWQHIKCSGCGGVPTCYGSYEGGGVEGFCCDDCCGHGNEDGWCKPLDRAGRALLERLKRFQEMDAARGRGHADHEAGKTQYDNPWPHSCPVEGHKAHAWDTGWFLAAGNKARAELRQAREEVERLKIEVETLCKDMAGEPSVSTDYPRVRIQRLRAEKAEAALGRAYAALQALGAWQAQEGRALGSDRHQDYQEARDLHAKFNALYEAAMNDPDAKAAGEYVRELEAVYEAAKVLRETWGFGNWNREDAAEERLIEALDKVKHV